jgi:hypothetical protein
MGLLASLPGEKLAEALYSGTTSLSPVLAIKSLVSSANYWRTILKFYRTKRLADDLLEHYTRYPSRPTALGRWQDTRDDIMEDIYETTGASPKY